ncbi:MAG: hypothetical protein U5R30_07465 [Deltaproteobacteria bacterium]|nr:hypothetical protein [Deltaproteobacteria bacterium]
MSDIIRLAERTTGPAHRIDRFPGHPEKVNAGQTFIRTAPNTFALATSTASKEGPMA